ncbi:hypothetical protein LB505_013697 [Fusarium chuoi]|nr:hypothetical protein LB505_013697 [Fusarium chuoi]
MSMRPTINTARSGSSLGQHQQRPSFIGGSEQRDRSHSAGRALRTADYSTSRSPITPSGLASPVSLPLTSKYAIPEQEAQTYRYILEPSLLQPQLHYPPNQQATRTQSTKTQEAPSAIIIRTLLHHP